MSVTAARRIAYAHLSPRYSLLAAERLAITKTKTRGVTRGATVSMSAFPGWSLDGGFNFRALVCGIF